MKLKLARLSRFVPPAIAVGVIVVVCLFRLYDVEAFNWLERHTYDMRVRAARRFPEPVATNLGAVFISDDTIPAIGALLGRGKHYGVNWPRYVYGEMLDELSAEGASSVAFDILFAEPHPRDDPLSVPPAPALTNFLNVLHPGQDLVTFADQGQTFVSVESDDYLAWQLNRAGMAVLAADQGVYPYSLFATNTAAVGDISADRDSDGILRRAQAFKEYHFWHPILLAATEDTGADWSKTRIEPGRILLFNAADRAIRDAAGNQLIIRLNTNGDFDVRPFLTSDLAPGVNPWRKPFGSLRVWHTGIQLAAQALGLDLDHAHVDLLNGKITLRNAAGLERIIPVDENGYFYINWDMTATDPRLAQRSLEEVVRADMQRAAGAGGIPARDYWKNKLVMVGSTATGNNLADRGSTPLEKDTYLVSEHWNVANSILTGRFVHPASETTELFLIVVMGALTAWLTLRSGALASFVGVVGLVLVYCAVAFYLYTASRYWLPLVLPCGCCPMIQYLLLMTYRYFFEEREKRRVRSIFSRLVSPNVASELIGAEKLELGGTRRSISVLFADVRGFTEFTDRLHEQTEEYVRLNQLTGSRAEACHDDSAREALNTVNLYLAQVADMVKKHNGTLDKYIGDCVMAFWGAPTPNPQHALYCVRAAIDAQRAIHDLNQLRTAENHGRELENKARVSAGLPAKPLHATLMLGTGINTGPATVGLMGSQAHIVNYTIFGREVNLASRLEHESGHGRIVISEATYQHLLRDDSRLAATCKPLAPVIVKGIRSAVKIYEVPWQQNGAKS